MKNNSENKKEKIGVILMTYGSATTADHVKEYFENIYGGKASPELIADFENRYRIVGGSPLIRITKEQAALVEKELYESERVAADADKNGKSYIVRAGMRHSAPKISEVVAECHAAGADRLVGIVLSPQFSSIIMEGYRTAFLKAATEHGYADGEAVIAGPWPTEPHFIELLASRVKKSLAALHKKNMAGTIPVIFTTHSLPQSVVAKDPAYLDQLKATIDAVRAKLGEDLLGDEGGNWYAGYQSAGHTPEAWLKPDLTDILEKIAGKKAKAALIVPIQFLADHLEILFDLDVAAKQQCEERGVEYHRIELPNTDPLFIKTLASIARAL
jgi:ferrochelatase